MTEPPTPVAPALTLEQAMTDGDADLVKRVHVLVAEVKRLQSDLESERADYKQLIADFVTVSGSEQSLRSEVRRLDAEMQSRADLEFRDFMAFRSKAADSIELAKLQRDELRDEVEEQSRLRQFAVEQMDMWQGQWRELQDEHGRVLQERDAARQGVDGAQLSASFARVSRVEAQLGAVTAERDEWSGRAQIAEASLDTAVQHREVNLLTIERLKKALGKSKAQLSTLRSAAEGAVKSLEIEPDEDGDTQTSAYLRLKYALDSIERTDKSKESQPPIVNCCHGGGCSDRCHFDESSLTASYPTDILSAVDELLEAWDLNEVEVAYRRLGRAVEAVRAARKGGVK